MNCSNGRISPATRFEMTKQGRFNRIRRLSYSCREKERLALQKGGEARE